MRAEGHWLDHAVGALLGRSTLFTDGWGDTPILDELSKPHPSDLTDTDCPPIVWDAPRTFAGLYRRTGRLLSPAHLLFRDEATKTARIELLAHQNTMRDDEPLPETSLAVYLASSGEEGFLRRRMFALPLVRKHKIAAVLLENPFYGARRPKGQKSSYVRSVAEQLAMNRATVREARALLARYRALGLTKLAVTGYSMGGFMAALTATRCPFPVAVIPCAAGLSPAPVFVEGVLSRSIEWGSLSKTSGSEQLARARLAEIFHAVAAYLLAAPKPKSAILVAAKDDGFVNHKDVRALAEAWPDAELRWLEGGHVSAYVRHQAVMRQAIADAIERL